jgi:hypothetical protein
MRKLPDAHAAAKYNAGRNMNVRADLAIVFDDRSTVDNAVFANYGIGIDDGSGHYDGSKPYGD